MRTIGLRNLGVIPITEYGKVHNLPPFVFDLGLSVFTPVMAKRAIAGSPFEADVIYQGDWDGTGTPDVVTFDRGAHLANPTYHHYANFDPYQGTALKWWTAETASADRAVGYSYVWYVSGDYYARYDYANSRFEFTAGGVTHTDAQAIVAGTTYLVAFSYDTKKTIDGTNYCRSAIQNVIAYGGTALTVSAPDATIAIGSDGTTSPANALIGGLMFSRRVLTDSNGYGTNSGGNDDELGDIYNAGVGVDPATLFGSNDVTAMQPTDSTAGAYVTGEGEMWSEPLGSSIVDDTHMSQGRMPGGAWAIEFNGTSTEIDCGSDLSLDDMPAGGHFTAACRFRPDATSTTDVVMMKGAFWSAGWFVQLQAANVKLYLVLGGTSVEAYYAFPVAADFYNGKHHYIVVYYNNTTKVGRVSVDGLWGATDTGAGAYATDAAANVYLGTASFPVDGAMSWAEFSDNDRHGGAAGTDFENALPIAPYDDINTIEAWDMEEGTGGNTVAMVNPGPNDGTITNGSWSNIWARELTPVEPVALAYDASTTATIVTDAVNIQDLPDAAFTFDIAFRADSYGEGNIGAFLHKLSGANGWACTFSLSSIVFRINGAVSDSAASFAFTPDSVWHTLRGTFDDGGDQKSRLYLDGILQDTGDALGGAYQSDVGVDVGIGCSQAGAASFGGAIGYVRLSDSLRSATTVKYFVTDDICNPPGNDVNAELLIAMRDGTGATATDTSGNGYNGAITNDDWLNTTDGEEIEPGNRMYPHSMFIGSDQADDGIVIGTAPTNPSDSVLLPRISCGQDGQAWPIVDFNGSEFKLPRMQDVHTGGAASATLVNANGNFTQQMIGWLVYNIPDQSVGTITGVVELTGTITAPLAGGGSNDWQNGEAYIVRPPGNDNYCDYPIGAYGIHVLRTAVAAVDLKVKNEHGLGMMAIQLEECQPSLLSQGDMEAGAGNPYIPTGWANVDLDPGDTLAEVVVIHSGAQSLEFAVGASAEGIRQQVTAAIGSFIQVSMWSYCDGSAGFTIGGLDATQLVVQADPAAFNVATPHTAVWSLTTAVFRVVAANPFIYILADAGAAGARYIDDALAIDLDAISLTVAPANQANSLEGTGIRVGGLSTLQQPVPVGYLRAREGHIRFPITPRHDPATAVLFGNAQAYECSIYFDATRLIEVYWSAANTLTLNFNDGGGAHTANWNAVGMLPVATWYQADLIYCPAWMRLYVDNQLRIDIAQPPDFTAIPNVANWLTDNAGIRQGDSVVG